MLKDNLTVNQNKPESVVTVVLSKNFKAGEDYEFTYSYEQPNVRLFANLTFDIKHFTDVKHAFSHINEYFPPGTDYFLIATRNYSDISNIIMKKIMKGLFR